MLKCQVFVIRNETMADSILLILCNLSANCCISQRTQMWKSQEHPTVAAVLYFGLIRLNLIIGRHEHEKIDGNEPNGFSENH